MRRAVLLLPLLGVLQGCAGASSADTASNASQGGNYTGGQTGSLIPNCGIAPLAEQGSAVPSGEQALVFYTRGCPTAVVPEDLVITDAEGQAVDVELEPLGDDAVLIKGIAGLAEGQYTVQAPDMPEEQVSLAVGAPAMLPTEIGEVTLSSSNCDSTDIDLQLDPAALPYASLMQFWLRVDQGAPFLWADYGALIPEDGVVSGTLPHCSTTGCLTAGGHQLTISAKIAGETADPDPLSASFQVSTCFQSSASSAHRDQDSGARACGASIGTPRSSWASLATVLTMLALLLGVRRTGRTKQP